MIKMARMTQSFMKRTMGVVGGVPRIRNIDRNTDIVGYAQVNQMATTSFSRIKVNKGFLFCKLDDITEGELLLDRADNKKYFLMSAKMEMLNGEAVYIDCALYYCDATASIERWSDGVRDTFGRVVDPAPEVLFTDVPIVTNPQTYNTLEQQDRTIAQDKVRIFVQAKIGIKESDRITSSNGDTYKVLSIDKVSWPGVWTCYTDVDVR